jgi:spore coat protein CotH
MKNISIVLHFVFFMFLLTACQVNGIDETDYDDIATILQSRLPSSVNSDFLLPSYGEYDITWTFKGNQLEDIFIYESPFADETTQITATIKNGRTTKTYDFPFQLIAVDSAKNNHKIYITMDIPINQVSRTEYNSINILFEGNVNGETYQIFQTENALLRGRGNSTWGMPKKPFRIRFLEEVSILGLPTARDYVLLAEYADKSLLRNTLVHKFSSYLDTVDHVIQTRVVELYVNGNYEGVYTLTEQVELREEKLFFESIPGVVDTGYFLELDHRFFEKGGVENVDGIVVAGIPYEIVSPNPSNSNYTSAQTAFIKQYIIDMETALLNKEGYEEYIDIDNWIDFFIVQELFKNVDVGWSSINIYKLPGGPIKMGPLWDFDLAIGNADYIDYGVENWYGMRDHKNRWFKLMMDIPEVREQFKLRYMEIYFNHMSDFLDSIWVMHEAINPAAQRNFNRWQILDHYVWPNPQEMVQAKTHEAQVNYVYHYIKNRSEWMLIAVQSEDFAQGRFD